ncbi:MAG TPA: hypothetical protein VGF56_05460 [Rhizomicrobium sp.]|jgi:hypothetical protein
MEIDAQAVMAAFAQPEFDGAFRGPLGDYIRMIALRRPVLFFAFAPKAAGTFLRTAAIHAVDGNLVRAVHAQGGRDAQLYLPTFIQYYLGGLCEGPMVVHAHMQRCPATGISSTRWASGRSSCCARSPTCSPPIATC